MFFTIICSRFIIHLDINWRRSSKDNFLILEGSLSHVIATKKIIGFLSIDFPIFYTGYSCHRRLNRVFQFSFAKLVRSGWYVEWNTCLLSPAGKVIFRTIGFSILELILNHLCSPLFQGRFFVFYRKSIRVMV